MSIKLIKPTDYREDLPDRYNALVLELDFLAQIIDQGAPLLIWAQNWRDQRRSDK